MIRAEVTAKIYSLAETGKRALLVKYDETEGKKNLPYEVADFDLADEGKQKVRRRYQSSSA